MVFREIKEVEAVVRSVLAFLVLGGMMLILASIAIGAMISLGNGRPNWLLIGVFALDSAAILYLFSWLVRRGGDDASD